MRALRYTLSTCSIIAVIQLAKDFVSFNFSISFLRHVARSSIDLVDMAVAKAALNRVSASTMEPVLYVIIFCMFDLIYEDLTFLL
jgi:hypothetical protein